MPSPLAVLGVSPSTPWGSHPEPPRLPQTPSTPAYPDKDRRTHLFVGEAGAPSGCSKTDSPNEYILLSVFAPQSQLGVPNCSGTRRGTGSKRNPESTRDASLPRPKSGSGDNVPSKVLRGAPRAYSGRCEELFGSPCHSFSRASLWLARSPAFWTDRLKHKEGLSFIGRGSGYVVLTWLIHLRLVSVSRIVFRSCLVARGEASTGRKTCSPLNNHPYLPTIRSRFRILKNEERKRSSFVPHFPDPRSRFRFQTIVFSYCSFFLLPFSSLGTTIAPLSVQILNQ